VQNATDRPTRRRPTGRSARSGVLGLLGGAALLLLAACGGGGTSAAAGGSAGSASTQAQESPPAGDIPDSVAFVPYTPPGGRFTVSVPEGWSRTGTGAGTAAASLVSWTDKLNTAGVELRPAATAPTPASVQAADLPALAAQPGYRAGAVSTVQRRAGQAVLVTYRVSSPPNPVTGKTYPNAVERYSFFRNGTEAVITLSGPVGADNVDAYRTITDSFRWGA
jgi:hypothetical protein